ncbi:MAG: hypothetical protein WCY71_10715 [Halothiobacillaceae bacterium]|jgi:hypothetical protein
MKTYNHAYTVAFSVKGSTHPEGADVTPEQFEAALTARIRELNSNVDEWAEAVGLPFDSFEEEVVLQPFTVLGFCEDTGQVLCDHVEAENDLHAFHVAAQQHGHISFVAALPGHLQEGEGISFPGTGFVDALTVLDQPEVFGGTYAKAQAVAK